jgi:hypothetical protein
MLRTIGVIRLIAFSLLFALPVTVIASATHPVNEAVVTSDRRLVFDMKPGVSKAAIANPAMAITRNAATAEALDLVRLSHIGLDRLVGELGMGEKRLPTPSFPQRRLRS